MCFRNKKDDLESVMNDFSGKNAEEMEGIVQARQRVREGVNAADTERIEEVRINIVTTVVLRMMFGIDVVARSVAKGGRCFLFII